MIQRHTHTQPRINYRLVVTQETHKQTSVVMRNMCCTCDVTTQSLLPLLWFNYYVIICMYLKLSLTYFNATKFLMFMILSL